MQESLLKIFPVCLPEIPPPFWEDFLLRQEIREINPEDLPRLLDAYVHESDSAGYLPDLARVELAVEHLSQSTRPSPGDLPEHLVNPTLELLEVEWASLLMRLDNHEVTPTRQQQRLLFWRHPHTGTAKHAIADEEELLALKIVVEELDPIQLASELQYPVGIFDKAIDRAVWRGLLLAPPSGLNRDTTGVPLPSDTLLRYRQADIFTLQWHITHTCDLHCRHCYDRSRRDDVDFKTGLTILDQMRQFCRDQHVGGQVSFSGGNPFMHPRFSDLYRAAHERNLTPAILGNPVSEAALDSILAIRPPVFYQVSLEGLQGHNDHIRGSGNFDAVLSFLDLLKKKKVYSMVMLTLTRANLDQVLPLAEVLRNRVDLFTYNRLAMVGEGASLLSPNADEYQAFVSDYLAARRDNPVMALKDSLLNIELEQMKPGIFGGCTGFGCGAAFNFVSLLPDGQVHACRKFPSPIGDINQQSLDKIYASEAAQTYRRGCTECDDCRLRPVCGGCLAVAYGFRLDPFKERDPGCFFDKSQV